MTIAIGFAKGNGKISLNANGATGLVFGPHIVKDYVAIRMLGGWGMDISSVNVGIDGRKRFALTFIMLSVLSLPITPLAAQAAPDHKPAAKPAPQQPIRMGNHRALRPRGDPALWVPQSDYPMMEHPAEGTVGFTVTVGADGRPTSCKITRSSGYAELDAATCSGLMRRGRFDPRVENGEPVPATYSNRVIWVIPE
jgi:TonB family protein